MRRALHSACRASFAALVVLLFAAAGYGQSPGLSLPVAPREAGVRPLLDDANLNDVDLVGNRGWAVGDRGVVWQTEDGGRHWKLLSTPVKCSLRSVCFLTDRVGWIVGGGITPHLRTPYGVVLGTEDGGETWTLLADGTVPLLHHVQFFDLDEGIAVGESSPRFPTGIVKTSDGGKRWEAVSGTATDGWRCGAFLDGASGVVAGRLGQFQSVGSGKLLPALIKPTGLRGFRGVVLAQDFRGWLVGDGGLVLRTDNGGVSWRSPEEPLPQPLRDMMNFRAVASIGERVWVVGEPGSVVWHSPDGGRSWTAQPTGGPTPLVAVDFSSQSHGCAAGALGRILLTEDGGQTWKAVRADDRRAAVLAVHAHPSRVSLNVTTRYGAELGYRTAVLLAARRDVGPDGEAGRLLDLQLGDGVTSSGGAFSDVEWSFPLAIAGLDHDQDELVREWQLMTDNRLREVMLSRLVARIRTWRPDVVIVDEPAPDDAATKLLNDALQLALAQSGEEARFPEQRDLAGLKPWRPQRVFRRLLDGREGPVAIDGYEFLPRLGKSTMMAAADAYGCMPPDNVTIGTRETYMLTSPPEQGVVRDLFAGLVLAPGGPARRQLREIDHPDLERLQNLAEQQRNYAAYAERMFADSRHAAQVIAQLSDVTKSAPPDQAALQLFDLADEYRRRGDWELAHQVMLEVTQRYPTEPIAHEAMLWLLHFSASAEVGWQRLRESSVGERSTLSTDPQVITAHLQEAVDRARRGEDDDSASSIPSPIRTTSATGSLQFGGGLDQRIAKQRAWLEQAERVAMVLKRYAASDFNGPAIQFPLAALHRRQGRPQQSDEMFRGVVGIGGDGPWNRLAAGELWLTNPVTLAPHPTIVCRPAVEPPILDGLLGDACWHEADWTALRSESEHESAADVAAVELRSERARVQWCYDEGFLYFAARVPRVTSLRSDPPQLAGRTQDADLTGYDRLSLLLDVDRDYATFYRFDVDQRGCTADSCWENEAWNARRFIAADADDREWRIEMAIPFNELVAHTPQRGETWAAGIVRIMPAVGIKSWTAPSGSIPRPEGFGFLRFD